MEAAGFAIGVVGAVGVLGHVFDGCMKAYSYFTVAASFGRDSERLLCKIRIEEMRLLVWGREWGVKEGKLEAHLAAVSGENDGLKKLAETILSQLLDTIGNSKKLKERYGVREGAPTGKTLNPSRSPDLGAGSGWGEFKMKAKWVVGDKEKFESLLKELRDYNDGLERLFPPARIATLQRTWTNELLQTAKRDVCQLNLLETASSGVYPQLTACASLKQLRINLDEEESKRFKPTSELKIPKHCVHIDEDEEKRVTGEHKRSADGLGEAVVVEWITYEPEMDLDTRLVIYQRVDSLARMVHSASNRHPDLHTLDCVGYIDDSEKSRYGLVYRCPARAAQSRPVTLASLIANPQLRTPDLSDRFRLAHSLAVALWSFHSLDWLHKTFYAGNILFFHAGQDLEQPYVTGFESSRPDYLNEMTVASKNDTKQDLYRHPDSLGIWRETYRKAFDVYSLGLVLLEIGLWKSVQDFHRPKYTPALFRDKVILTGIVPKLGGKTGRRYQAVVERCLRSHLAEDRDEVEKSMEWIVLTLESLRV